MFSVIGNMWRKTATMSIVVKIEAALSRRNALGTTALMVL
jgi:hypothetical protein